ncbi:MAG: membrane protein insertase YidC [Clostridia bacterium]|nr:membrane protein insertase YidC [Clostridia bacterium]
MDLVQIICTPFSYIVSAVNAWTGSYLLALLAFTIVMKVVLFPLSIKQQKNSVRQAKLRPREEVIRAKYAGRTDKPTQQKMQQEIMEMYQEEKFSPAAGCLPLLIQLPLLIILYNIVRQPLMYTVRYNTEEIDALNATMAITEYYDARSELSGAVGGEFSLVQTARGEYVFFDPATGTTNRVVEETHNNQKFFVFYAETEEGYAKDYIRFSKKTPYEHAASDVAQADTLPGIPMYPVNANGTQMDQSAMVRELKKNTEYYTDVYETVIKDKEGKFSTAEELDLAGRLPNFDLFGGAINLGDTPVVSEFNWLLVIPVLTFITSFGSQWLTRKFSYQPQAQQEAAGSMRMMNVMMPLMSVWITFMVPAALGVYWIMQNLISPLQQIILAKCWPVPKYTEDELKKLKNEYVAKQKGKTDKKSIPAPKRRSLVYDDDDVEETPAPKAAVKQETAEDSSPIGKADLK